MYVVCVVVTEGAQLYGLRKGGLFVEFGKGATSEVGRYLFRLTSV